MSPELSRIDKTNKKMVAVATSLEDLKNQFQTDHLQQFCQLRKFGKDRSCRFEIIGLTEIALKINKYETAAEHREQQTQILPCCCCAAAGRDK